MVLFWMRRWHAAGCARCLIRSDVGAGEETLPREEPFHQVGGVETNMKGLNELHQPAFQPASFQSLDHSLQDSVVASVLPDVTGDG